MVIRLGRITYRASDQPRRRLPAAAVVETNTWHTADPCDANACLCASARQHLPSCRGARTYPRRRDVSAAVRLTVGRSAHLTSPHLRGDSRPHATAPKAARGSISVNRESFHQMINTQVHDQTKTHFFFPNDHHL
jgi:hypothetical protein